MQARALERARAEDHGQPGVPGEGLRGAAVEPARARSGQRGPVAGHPGNQGARLREPERQPVACGRVLEAPRRAVARRARASASAIATRARGQAGGDRARAAERALDRAAQRVRRRAPAGASDSAITAARRRSHARGLAQQLAAHVDRQREARAGVQRRPRRTCAAPRPAARTASPPATAISVVCAEEEIGSSSAGPCSRPSATRVAKRQRRLSRRASVAASRGGPAPATTIAYAIPTATSARTA